ncbi:hypothetical protein AN8989.2 [Aspergillus nidulans FGSC A4]|uniref:Glyoxalase family protein (AFU_orthologue AFUA_5G14830) n=1 Tax=Emericella nidulans (strain FGSC A4 / ATCC 38163 / CBS 112.46 / NRRL 194 / M139) TaxID=227321 RepID=Q5ARU1_EMENI|nr:hypothetical protein [Aspergillus nidulans FGSC A4]EAA64321.1 hypothetical protein AN8989.2 [Aspergillus nidulans FGSC A4]CBF84508.1 TPA: glyoxalase family protein (AFU_orthologue; AFUA_5G14830) [Aspergillus nidulans FGSC A4]|eukprot:XP_682258.1 hypothetical protein AN8989.2 [Aspergillus nidulans FGSC A4]
MELDPTAPLPSSKIDHIGITAPTEQLESLIEFYLKALALAPLQRDHAVSWGCWARRQGPGFLDLRDEDRKTVDAFHEAALAAGGKCNGKPGLRTEYHPNYYAAFIIDPRGNNVEIVCHLPVEE